MINKLHTVVTLIPDKWYIQLHFRLDQDFDSALTAHIHTHQLSIARICAQSPIEDSDVCTLGTFCCPGLYIVFVTGDSFSSILLSLCGMQFAS